MDFKRIRRKYQGKYFEHFGNYYKFIRIFSEPDEPDRLSVNTIACGQWFMPSVDKEFVLYLYPDFEEKIGTEWIRITKDEFDTEYRKCLDVINMHSQASITVAGDGDIIDSYIMQLNSSPYYYVSREFEEHLLNIVMTNPQIITDHLNIRKKNDNARQESTGRLCTANENLGDIQDGRR